MDTPKKRSKKSKKKASRQPSPAQLKINSIPSTPTQPEAGPSRLISPEPTTVEPKILDDEQPFGADFISLNIDDEDVTEDTKLTRDWDKGKIERDRDQQAGRKRRRDEPEPEKGFGAHNNSHKDHKALRQAPWTAYVDWHSCRNTAQLMHKEVEAFLLYISPTPIEHNVRYMIVQLISSAIKKVYCDAEVLPFGSFGTKLYLPQGDIDLVVLSKTLAYNEKVSALRSLANIVRQTGLTDKVTIITKAKVPIIKFVTKYGWFPVDISMNQPNGVKTGEMINRFLNEFPALRALVLIIKAFLNQRSMNEVYSGGLGSYAIVCLAVSFLQMHPKIRRAEIDPSRNLGVLLIEFFELYGKYFNYSNTGISVRNGGSYYSKDERGWKDYNKPFLLSIEDPGDINNDISRGTYNIRGVRQTFAGAYEMMKSEIYKRANLISGRYGGYSYNPEEMSVLRTILGIRQDVINHRKVVVDVYSKGDLARIVGVDPHAGIEMGYGEGKKDRRNADKRTRDARNVVEEAWGEADMELGTTDEEGPVRSMIKTDGRNRFTSKGKEKEGESRVNTGGYKDRDEESESRYDMVSRTNRSRQQAQNGKPEDHVRKKRRSSATDHGDRAGTIITLYTSDDEEDVDDSDSSDGVEGGKTKSSEKRGTDGKEDVQLPIHVDPSANSSATGTIIEIQDSEDELDEVEQAYIKAADALTENDEDDEDSAYTKGMKGKAKAKTQKPMSGSQRRAFWAAKSTIEIDSDSDSSS